MNVAVFQCPAAGSKQSPKFHVSYAIVAVIFKGILTHDRASRGGGRVLDCGGWADAFLESSAQTTDFTWARIF